jgi:hypothetical protein
VNTETVTLKRVSDAQVGDRLPSGAKVEGVYIGGAYQESRLDVGFGVSFGNLELEKLGGITVTREVAALEPFDALVATDGDYACILAIDKEYAGTWVRVIPLPEPEPVAVPALAVEWGKEAVKLGRPTDEVRSAAAYILEQAEKGGAK